MSEKYFTRDQANALLSELRPLLTELQALHKQLSEGGQLTQLQTAVKSNGGGKAAENVMHATEAASRLLKQIIGFGVQIRDASTGLIDFPAQREGEEICLCWRLDEPSVDFWHAVDAGFQGRQPL